jgi:hypothetical protein
MTCSRDRGVEEGTSADPHKQLALHAHSGKASLFFSGCREPQGLILLLLLNCSAALVWSRPYRNSIRREPAHTGLLTPTLNAYIAFRTYDTKHPITQHTAHIRHHGVHTRHATSQRLDISLCSLVNTCQTTRPCFRASSRLPSQTPSSPSSQPLSA